MTESEYESWLAEAIPAYATEKVGSGQWSKDESLERSRKEHDELLPQGPQTAENYLFTVIDQQGEPVGSLWFAVKQKFNVPIAYVLNIQIASKSQRQGHAFRAFLALEQEIGRMGLHGVALHVFGHNIAARALYTKLGYEPTNINLFKPVRTGV